MVHESHNPVDVSDVSLSTDVVCSHCHRSDEELEEPCPLNPFWDVTI